MGILSWILLGLIAGALAKWLLPGRDPGGFVVTTLLGIGGAFVGGYIGSFFGYGDVTEFSVAGIVTAMVGAIVLLSIYRIVR